MATIKTRGDRNMDRTMRTGKEPSEHNEEIELGHHIPYSHCKGLDISPWKVRKDCKGLTGGETSILACESCCAGYSSTEGHRLLAKLSP